ncbi:PAS domain S-box protein [Chroococcidiopsis sp. TS-821]|uniref:PAS domain S-box protein n=1 Tax=Chroococcidiopsis sp. TS-821 TaxID=1378066 RepID=UPI000CEEB9C5|nr:PAS domain S-box protein [Chroococcidiopsis sp. TS-821]PPS42673.1 hypothetical protein B1A85_13190 [Chroococcidiopsis sp. TS-821]
MAVYFGRKKNFLRGRYTVAIATICLTLLVKLLLAPLIDDESPFLLFFFAIVVSTWYGGKSSGIFATILAALCADYFLISPFHSFVVNTVGYAIKLSLFIFEGAAITCVVAELSTAKKQAETRRLEALRYQENLQQSEERFRLFVESVSEYAIFMLNADAHIVSWNVGAEHLFGYKEAEILGKHFSSLFTPEDISSGKPQQEIEQAIALGRAEAQTWHLRSNGTWFWAGCVITALRDDNGCLRGFAKVIHDFTEHHQAEIVLQKAKEELELRVQSRTFELQNANEQLYSEIIERQQIEEALLDSQTRLQLINSISTAMMLGMSVEQIIKRTVRQISECFPVLRVAYSIIDQNGTMTVIHSLEPTGIPSLQGATFDLQTMPDYLQAIQMNVPIVVEDIAQDLRFTSQNGALFRSYGVQAFVDVPLQCSDHLIGLLRFDAPQPRKWSNHEIGTLIVITQYLSIIIKNAQAQQERDRAELALQKAHDELELRVKNRTAQLAKANEELKTEICERRRIEESLRQSEERLRFALSAADMVAWDWNTLTDEISHSDNAPSVIGLPPKTKINTATEFFNLIYVEDRDRVLQELRLQSTSESKHLYSTEFRLVHPDGSIRWMANQGKVSYDMAGKVIRVSGILRDITKQKQIADQIQASLVEKEVLLKEIHHRVKNNLQIISSLLSLQSGYITDQQTLEILKTGENRIASMALIHEQLYQSRDLAKIDFADYIQNLVANLFSSYDVSSERIILHLNIERILLSLDIAIPCGLIINELISNSLKHAFPNHKKGNIYINLAALDDRYHLTIKDDGIGLPKHVNPNTTDSLGLQIVSALTQQLEGSLDIHSDSGAEFNIKF